MEHFFSPNSGKDQKKKKVFTKNGTLFSPNSGGHLRSDAHKSQIIGGDADINHTQTIGEDTVKLFSAPEFRQLFPRVSAPLQSKQSLNNTHSHICSFSRNGLSFFFKLFI